MKALALVALAGCFPYSELPNDRPDPKLRKLSEATILEMNINLYKQPGLCPGKEGKLYVNATVKWPGMKPVPRTLGTDVDSLDPATFQIQGTLLKGDQNAHLFPDADVVKSIESGFVIDVTYMPQPTKFHFHEMFPPEYSCFDGWGENGGQGGMGGGGGGGNRGDLGHNGGHGENGGHGDNGQPGGRITAYVTVVSTKFYPRLFAVIANGTFFLAPADRQLTFAAIGGQGGPGGQGGSGGAGGDQPTKSIEVTQDDGTKKSVIVATGRPGNGGNGGHGGDGGDGGNGGQVEIIYDSAFPELRNFMATDVRGGAEGEAGQAGGGGNGGGTNAERDAAQGSPGNDGQPGRNGRQGNEGRAMVHAGSVVSQFRNIHGITIGGGGGGSGASAPPPPEEPVQTPVTPKPKKHGRHR